MNQSEIINYLYNTPKYIQDLVKVYRIQEKIDEFEEQDKTLEQRINECAKRCMKDLEEFNSLVAQYNTHVNQTK